MAHRGIPRVRQAARTAFVHVGLACRASEAILAYARKFGSCTFTRTVVCTRPRLADVNYLIARALHASLAAEPGYAPASEGLSAVHASMASTLAQLTLTYLPTGGAGHCVTRGPQGRHHNIVCPPARVRTGKHALGTLRS